MDIHVREGWLYVLGEQSVYVMREPLHVLIYGPGVVQHTQRLQDETSADAFTDWLGEFLTSSGWRLHAVVDRRAGGGEPPPDRERRAARPRN